MRLCGNSLRHKGQLKYRFQLNLFQKIKQLIKILPEELWVAVFILAVYCHFIIEYAVKAYVFKTDFILNSSQLFLPVGTQSFVSPACTDAF